MNFWEKNGNNSEDGTNSGNRKGGNFGSEGRNEEGGFRGNVGYDAFGRQNVEEQLGKYRNMSEEQLSAELLRTAGGMRAEGKLSVEELESFYQKATAFLSTEQLAKLRTLINMLK